ncbi:MAG: DUF4160 domain-containing protein [Selenomonadaceae bacterium]|nr:DUF4160 domain-containing protein [Selenomonadaceae bacterium]
MPTYYRNGSLWIELRTREGGHPMAHVHAHCDGQSVSMALDGTVLDGRIRSDRLNEVKAWVNKNKTLLESEWRRIHGV